MLKNSAAAGAYGGLFSARLSTKAGQALLNAGLCCAFGFLSARALIFGSYAPFGVAAVAAGSGVGSVWLLAGACFGYILPGGAGEAVKYLAAAIAVFALKWLFSGFKSVAGRTFFCGAFASCSLFVTSMAFTVSDGLQLADVGYSLAETLLCGCSVLFMRKALPLLRSPSKIWGLTRQQMICVTVSLCILLLALEGVKAEGVSLGRILGVLAVLVAARYGGEAGGCIAGVAVGIILGLGDRDMSRVLAGYGFGGLLAGVFSPLGRFACAAAFILANMTAGIYLGGLTAVVTGLYEVTIATVVFMLLPERLLCRLSALFAPEVREQAPGRTRETVSQRLLGAAGVLDGISGTLREVNERLSKLNRDDVSAVFTDGTETICRRCGNRMFCWETAYNDTMGAFNDMTVRLRQKGELSREDVPSHFAARCCKLGVVLRAVNRSYAAFLTRKGCEDRADRLRGVLTEQYAGVGALLRDMERELSVDAEKEFLDGGRVRSAFAECGLDASSAVCRISGRGRVTVEAKLPAFGKTRVSRSELAETLSRVCGRKLSEPAVAEEDGSARVTLAEKPELTVRFGQASLAKRGEKLCGDTCESFLDGAGRAVMIMSDGMGCGGQAAVDSGLAAGLMSRMLHAGFSFDTAMKIVNSAMMLRPGDESFATLDIASVDLYTGEAAFLKAGAPATYLRRGGRAERIMESSMPAGILPGTKFAKAEARLRPGDLVLLASDGLVSADDKWLIRELESFSGDNLRGFASRLVQKGKELRGDGHDDDVTVLAAAVR